MLELFLAAALLAPEDVGSMWGTADRERAYYRVVRLPIPEDLVVEAGAFATLPDGRIAIGTRHGDVLLASGVDEEKPEPRFEVFATGLDEIFGLEWIEGGFLVTSSAELTRVLDTDGDGRADRFDTVSDAWGYENYHEYAFGSKRDPEGNVYVALGLSLSYYSRALFRGWVLQVTPDGETIPYASGLRSPAGIGPNERGALFVIESQGPWNSSCSLKAVTRGAFLGHPASYNWYPFAPDLGQAPAEPASGSRVLTERERVPELVPYAVIFPYIRMGRSITGFEVDRTGGRFGPFANQLFLGDYTQSIVLRATTERVNGVWQGACYPFREGLSTGLLNVHFTPGGDLLCGGTNRGWPVRGLEPFALERLEWTGVTPFEIERVSITPDGFRVRFTLPVDVETAADPASWALGSFTHIYHGAYGGPEVDRTTPVVRAVALSADGREATLTLDRLVRGHVYELDLGALRSSAGEALVHRHAYYTVNEVPDRERWLDYPAGPGPGTGRRVVLLAADQEYRSEESLPMLARVLADKHGFDCTVLFAQDAEGRVDPTAPTRQQDPQVLHDVPGIEALDDADLLVLFSRMITLPDEQAEHVRRYLDSGKPLLAIRTANHGFLDFDYQVDGRRVRFGEDVLGGTFRNHHGRWHQDSTRGIVVDAARQHPILRGVDDVWGPSDVYRTYPEGGALPAGCTPLLLGQPLMGRDHDDAPNEELEALPVAWTTTWRGAEGRAARVFHTTMGSARDFESAGLRRLFVNAVYWCTGLEDAIRDDADVDPVRPYRPRASGFDYEALDVRPRPVAEYR